MEERSKTYTLAHLPDGWRVNFSTGITPDLGLKPHHGLFEVIGRVETLYPEYQPRFTVEQLGDYLLEVDRRGSAQELQNLVSQTSELKTGLIGFSKKLPQIGASKDREMGDDLTTLQHELSDLRAHVDIARRELVRAKRVGQGEKLHSGLLSPSVRGFLTEIQGAGTPERHGLER